MIKAVFFDIDGTLAGTDIHRMTESVRAALNELKAGGVRIFLATGRHRLEIESADLVAGVEFDGEVLLNGQYCTAGNRVIYRNPICPGDIKGIVELLEKNPFPCVFLEEEDIYINYVDERVMEEQKKIAADIPPVRGVRCALRRDVYQVIPYVRGEREAEILKKMPHCVISRWSDSVVDVVPMSGSKSKGIAQMAACFGIDKSEIMAFGDGRNDIDMLQYAGIGIAMGNAREEVKAAADYVTASVSEDGVREGLRHFGLIR